MELTRDELSKKIGDLIKSGKEGETWDFKGIWYKNNVDLLHDILCMANNLSCDDAYIIIGVNDKTFEVVGENERGKPRKTADLTEWLHSGLEFAGDNIPTVKVINGLCLDGSKDSVDVIVIESTNSVPYFLGKDYMCGEKYVRAGVVYVRRMDTNTPKNRSATYPEVEKLWKKRFGLTLSIEERFELLLSNKDDWDWLPYKQTHNYLSSEKKDSRNEKKDSKKIYIVHKYCPDFFIEIDWNGELREGCHVLPVYLYGMSFESGVLRLFYDKFLIGVFGVNSVNGIYFVKPAYITLGNCTFYYGKRPPEFPILNIMHSVGSPEEEEIANRYDGFGYFYFVENNTGFKLNNILKKVLEREKRFIREKMFIEEVGRGKFKPKTEYNEDEYACFINDIKKRIIYFENEEEKFEYEKYIVENRTAILNDLERLNLDDDSIRIKDKIISGEMSAAIKYYLIGKFFVKRFSEWKFSRLLSRKEKWKFSLNWYSYSCASHCTDFQIYLYLKKGKKSSCDLPDFIAYLPAESEVIFREEGDRCCIYANIEEGGCKKFADTLYEFDAAKISDGIGLIRPNKNDGQDEFCYFYFLKDSEEYKINDIILQNCLTSTEVDDKIKDRFEECKKVFDSCIIHFKDEGEKGEFDKYLEEHKNIFKDINDFYKNSHEKFEEDCAEKINKLYPNSIEQYYPWKKQEVIHKWQKYCNEEFSKPGVDEIKIQEICARANKSLREEVSKLPQKCEKIRNKMDVKINAAVEKMVRVGVFAKKVTEIFGEWKKEKA